MSTYGSHIYGVFLGTSTRTTESCNRKNRFTLRVKKVDKWPQPNPDAAIAVSAGF